MSARIDVETARIIRKVFLPANPNKMRVASPEVIAAARRFISAIQEAEMAPFVEPPPDLLDLLRRFEVAAAMNFGPTRDKELLSLASEARAAIAKAEVRP